MYRYYCKDQRKKALLARSIKNLEARKKHYAMIRASTKKATDLIHFLYDEGMDCHRGHFITGNVAYASAPTLNDSIKADIRFRCFVKEYYWEEFWAHDLQFRNDYNGNDFECTVYAWNKMKESLAFIDFSKPYGEIPKPLSM